MIHQDDDPTYEMVRKECRAENEYTTLLESVLGNIICRFKNKRKSAQLDLDLEKTLFNIDMQKWVDIKKAHNTYVEANFARGDWKDMAMRLNVDGIRFDVLREDAEEWFDLVYGKFQAKEGMTGIAPGSRIESAPRIGRQHGP